MKAIVASLFAVTVLAGTAVGGVPDSTVRLETAGAIAGPASHSGGMIRLACSFSDCKAQCYYGERGQLLPRARRDACMRTCRPRRENC